MSVWATILELQHPDERDVALAGFPVVFVETDEGRAEEERLGSPWAFEHSGVIPERDGLRRGSGSLSSLPAFVEGARRAVPEEQFRDGDLPWLRIIVRTHPLPDEGDHYIVRTCKDALGGIRAIASGYRLCGGGAGGQEFRPRVEYRRYGLPDIGVCKAI